MTYEAPAVEGAVIRRIDELLKAALAEAGKVLQEAGASPDATWKATVPFIPLIRLLKDSLAVRTGVPPSPHPGPADLEGSALPTPEEIEAAYIERRPLRLVKERK